MEKDIQNIEMALIKLAEYVEIGEWDGIAENIRQILGYTTLKKTQ